jgi:DNA segregation ATPase FtsK/SpoIIIE-like protein
MDERKSNRLPRTSFPSDMARLGGGVGIAGALLWVLTDGEDGHYLAVLLWKLAAVIWDLGLLSYGWKHRKKCAVVLIPLLRRGVSIVRGSPFLFLSHPKLDAIRQQPEGSMPRKAEIAADSKGFVQNRGSPISLLPCNPRPRPTPTVTRENTEEWIASALQLSGFSVEHQPIEILAMESGPTLQTVTFRLPTKIQLSALIKKRDDLANHLGCRAGFDVVHSPFVSSASFVIPHKERAFVYLRDVMHDGRYRIFAEQAELPMVLGTDMLANPLWVDLAKLPHLLVAGATGSGKSVAINAMLSSLICCRGPDRLKLLLVDPKMVELAIYKGFPHLIIPPVTDMRRASLALQKVIAEMEQRYEVLAKASTRNIVEYNRKHQLAKLPYWLVVIDEYADLMLIAGDETEDAVQRIVQKARAAGIHMILATQRPSVDVVTGVIKANLPSRIAFRLMSSHDFRTVMEAAGPDLLGHGDGICVLQGGQHLRFQSASISVDDTQSTTFIEDLKQYWHHESKSAVVTGHVEGPFALEEVEVEPNTGDSEARPSSIHGSTDRQDEEGPGVERSYSATDEEEALYTRAKALALERGAVSIDLLKLQLGLPYLQANGIVCRMDEEGLLGEIDWTTRTRPWLPAQKPGVNKHFVSS